MTMTPTNPMIKNIMIPAIIAEIISAAPVNHMIMFIILQLLTIPGVEELDSEGVVDIVGVGIMLAEVKGNIITKVMIET